MKICFTHTYYGVPGGPENLIMNLAKEYTKKGHKVTIVAGDEKNKKRIKDAYIKGMKVVKVPFWDVRRLSFLWRLSLINPISSFLKENKFDIVHSHCAHTALAAAKAGVKYVFTPHFLIGSWQNSPWLYKRLFRKALEKATKVVSISLWMKKQIMKEYGVKSEHIYNGINVKKYKPLKNKNMLKRRYGLTDKKVALFLGRVDKQKNLETLINAIKLTEKRLDLVCLIVGTGPYIDKIKALAKGVKSIKFLGYVKENEKVLLYNMADLFVFSSLWEGLPVTGLEAMSCGIPIVGTKVGGLIELIGKNRGLLVHPKDPEKLSKAILTVLKSKKSTYSRGSRKWIIANASIERMAREYMQLYRQLA